MKSLLLLLTLLSILPSQLSFSRPDKMVLTSPGNEIRLSVQVNDSGEATYSVFYRSAAVIEKSSLGIIREDADFTSNLKFLSASDISVVSDNYTMLHGKTKEASYIGNRRTFSFAGSTGEKMDVIFQVSDDGVAFCYSFPVVSKEEKNIISETTGFSFVGGTKGWIQPRAPSKSGWNQTNPSYEEHYLEGVLLEETAANTAGWVFPALFFTGNCWVNITESWPDRNYCGSHLVKGTGSNEMIIAFPELTEGFTDKVVLPRSILPWATPWRIITLGSSPGTIVESTHGTDLAKPRMPGDFSYVKPGRASWSWALMKDYSVRYEVQKEFITYASEMGWEYCLIDVNWDVTIGMEKLAELSLYAAEMNVGLIVWYNSAGPWNTVRYHPKDKLLTHESRKKEFAALEKLNIKGIKVDFFGGDGQSMMDYYQDILEDAHSHHLIVNCHGSTFPRGLHRTWPNLVSMEAIKGFEFATFDQESANKVPSKAATLSFIRNAFDPMDFTPVCFNEYDNFERITGNGAELAMAVLFLSGVQHYAETPKGMANVPEYVRNIMSDIPVTWDETRFIDGYPSRYLVIARRTGDTWYIAGINAGKDPLDLILKIPFIKTLKGISITEGETLRSFTTGTVTPDAGKSVAVTLKPNGGFVFRFDPEDE